MLGFRREFKTKDEIYAFFLPNENVELIDMRIKRKNGVFLYQCTDKTYRNKTYRQLNQSNRNLPTKYTSQQNISAFKTYRPTKHIADKSYQPTKHIGRQNFSADISNQQ